MAFWALSTATAIVLLGMAVLAPADPAFNDLPARARARRKISQEKINQFVKLKEDGAFPDRQKTPLDKCDDFDFPERLELENNIINRWADIVFDELDRYWCEFKSYVPEYVSEFILASFQGVYGMAGPCCIAAALGATFVLCGHAVLGTVAVTRKVANFIYLFVNDPTWTRWEVDRFHANLAAVVFILMAAYAYYTIDPYYGVREDFDKRFYFEEGIEAWRKAGLKAPPDDKVSDLIVRHVFMPLVELCSYLGKLYSWVCLPECLWGLYGLLGPVGFGVCALIVILGVIWVAYTFSKRIRASILLDPVGFGVRALIMILRVIWAAYTFSKRIRASTLLGRHRAWFRRIRSYLRNFWR